MTKPTIHLNGSSVNDLLKGYSEAHHAVSVAMEKLAVCGPHGRDYYVTGPTDIDKAISEHRARLEKLKEVQDDLFLLSMHCLDNQTERDRENYKE